MASKQYELVVIGAGPGGYVSAIRAAQLIGKPNAVCVIEKDRLGGTCLNWGCIPTKALLRSADLLREINHAEEYGLKVEGVSFDISKVVARSRGIADLFNRNIGGLFRKNKIDHILGHAEITSPGKVKVTPKEGAAEEISFKKLLIATGCKPRVLPTAPFDGKTIIGSKEAMQLKELPKRMAIIGAGAIGMEFAYYFSAFGTKVSVIEIQDAVLPIEDHEVSAEVGNIFSKQYGVDLHMNTKVEKVDVKPAGGAKVTISRVKDGQQSELEVDLVLVAIGVVANLENLFTGSVKPELFKDHVKVNKQFETSVPGIFAIGDCIGPPWLAHVASHEGLNAVEQMFGHAAEPLDYSTIPGCTYIEPQVASIGLTERKALDAGHKIKIGKVPFKYNGKSQAHGRTEGFVKLIFSEPYGELLGAHIVGHNASDLIAELGLARKLEATYESIRDTVHAHPTLSEVMMEASSAAGGWVIHG